MQDQGRSGRLHPNPAPPLGAAQTRGMGPGVLIRDIARDMYIFGSAHVGRWKQLGKSGW
jgi:hypothetical protein